MDLSVPSSNSRKGIFMTKTFVCTFLAICVALPVWAGDTSLTKEGGVAVSGDKDTSETDKTGSQDKTIQPKEPEKVIVSGEFETI